VYIGGLLKVNPAERLSFGQILEVLVSIAESQNFSLNGPLPFKAASSPNLTGGPVMGESGGGIVNPLSKIIDQPGGNMPQRQLSQEQYSQNPGLISAGGGGSIFSSLKGSRLTSSFFSSGSDKKNWLKTSHKLTYIPFVLFRWGSQFN
jgi:hypothetical protein